MYTVYHISSKEYIGCTNDLERRMLGSYGHGISLDEVEILWETENIYEASYREQFEQFRIYGVSDNYLYHEHQSEDIKKRRNQAVSETLTGVPKSEEHRRKLSEAQIGKTLSEETRRKLSEAKIGEKNHFYGKTHSEETRRKISEAQKTRIKCQYCDYECSSSNIWRHVKSSHPKE